jgi:hypothetical protein
MRETGRLADDVFSDCPLNLGIEDTEIQIPIADSIDQFAGGIPIAMVSIGWFSPDATSDVRWRRRRVRGEQYGQAIVNTASGVTKADQRPIPVAVAMHVDFYATGDRFAIEDLLHDSASLGSARAGGLGTVKGWEVLPTTNEWWLRGPRNRLMRAVPSDPDLAVNVPSSLAPIRDLDRREATLRAPYWHPRTRRMCLVPVQRLGEAIE